MDKWRDVTIDPFHEDKIHVPGKRKMIWPWFVGLAIIAFLIWG